MALAHPDELDVDWQRLYELHARELRKIIRARVPIYAVEDVLQETFLSLFRGAHRVDFSRPMIQLLRTIAIRQCVQWWRSNRRFEQQEAVATETLSPSFVGGDDHVAALTAVQALGCAFSAMSPRHRRLLYRNAFEGQQPEQLGRSEGCSPKAIQSALERARATFRRHFESSSLIAGGAGWGRSRIARLRLHDRTLGIERVAVAVTAGVSFAAASFIAAPSASPGPFVHTRASLTSDSSEAPWPLGGHASTQFDQPVGRQARLAPGSEPAQATPSRPPVSVRTGASVTHGPESSAFEIRLELNDPVRGHEHSVGKRIDCGAGSLGGTACVAARAVPEAG